MLEFSDRAGPSGNLRSWCMTASMWRLQRRLIPVLGQWPLEAGDLGSLPVVLHRRAGQTYRGGYTALAGLLSEAQAEHVLDLAHGNVGPGHGTSSKV